MCRCQAAAILEELKINLVMLPGSRIEETQFTAEMISPITATLVVRGSFLYHFSVTGYNPPNVYQRWHASTFFMVSFDSSQASEGLIRIGVTIKIQRHLIGIVDINFEVACANVTDCHGDWHIYRRQLDGR